MKHQRLLLAGSVSIVTLIAGVCTGEGDRVTDHSNRINQEGNVSPHDKLGADQSNSLAGTVRKVFLHPANWFFDEFKGDEKDPNRPEKRIDLFPGEHWTKQGNVAEHDNHITVLVHTTEWANAGAFPIRADGNLKPLSDEPSNGPPAPPPQRHWAAIVSSVGVMRVADAQSAVNYVDVAPDDQLFIGVPYAGQEEFDLTATIAVSKYSGPSEFALRWSAGNNANPSSGALGNPVDVTLSFGNVTSGTTTITYGQDKNGNGTLDNDEIAGTATVYLCKVYFSEVNSNSGYDPIASPNAVLVPLNGINNEARVIAGLGEHIEELRLEKSSDDFGVANFDGTPLPVQGAVQRLRISGNNVNNAKLRAFVGKSDVPSAELDVLIRDRKDKTIDYIKVSMTPDGTNPPVNTLTENEAEFFLNEVTWGKQSNIYSSVNGSDGMSGYDLDGDGALMVPRELANGQLNPDTLHEWNRLIQDQPGNPGHYKIYHVRRFDDPHPGFTMLNTGRAALQSDPDDVFKEKTKITLAHEYGHVLGIEGHDGRINLDLMYKFYTPAMKRIRRIDWDVVQPLGGAE
jgi:hypothetical protein